MGLIFAVEFNGEIIFQKNRIDFALQKNGVKSAFSASWRHGKELEFFKNLNAIRFLDA